MTRHRQDSGFTLIEIVVVTALIAAMLLMAAGSFENLIPEYALRSASRSIAETMKMAKTQAAASGKDVYIGYEIPTHRYWLWVQFEEIDELTGKLKPPEYQVLFDKRLPDGIEFTDVTLGPKRITTSGVIQIRVTPLGSADHHIVNLQNEEGRKAAVKLNGLTGAVTFYDTHAEPDEVIKD